MFRRPFPRSPTNPGVILMLAAASLAACEPAPFGPPGAEISAAFTAETQGALLARVRAATAPYQSFEAALADGYMRVSPCVYNTPGSKAIHYQKPSLVDAVIDPDAPEVLLYEPTQNGNLRLVGIEFLIPAGAWDAGHGSIPTLGDQPFMDRRSPPFGAPIPNYALYVWLWRHNPDGMYEQYNPSVSCEYADVSVIA